MMMQSREKKAHAGKRRHKCSYCGDLFASSSALNKHQGTHVKGEPPTCSHCSRVFSYPSELRRHMMNHTGEKPYKCSVCYKRFTTPSQLKEHTRTHTGEKPHQCHVCHRWFSTSAGLTVHSALHSDKCYKCVHCAEIFRYPSDLRSHQSFKCSGCEKCFCDVSYLEEHAPVHTGQKPYECPLCGWGFPDAKSASKHISLHRGLSGQTKPNSHQCKQCGKSFISRYLLGAHKKKVHKLKPVASVQCLKSNMCTPASGLKSLLMLDTGGSPTPCPQCGMEFKTAALMKRHYRVHIGEKPHECSDCSKRFKSLYSLRAHVMCHMTSEGPRERFDTLSDVNEPLVNYQYEQAVCYYSLNPSEVQEGGQQPKKLSKPRKDGQLHRQVERQNCPLCPKTYVRSGYLQRHMKACHESPSQHVCSHCGYGFSDYHSLTEHLQTHCVVKQEHSTDTVNGISDAFDATYDTPYQYVNRHKCLFCSVSFCEAAALQQHVLSHVEQRYTNCDLCVCGFTLLEELEAHLISYHASTADYSQSYSSKQQSYKTDVAEHYKDYLKYVCSLDYSKCYVPLSR